MAKTEQEQVEKTEEQAVEETQETSEEFEALTDEETAGEVGKLLGTEQAETTEEQTEEVETEVKTEETPEVEETPVPMIDGEFVKLYPATKAYIGKPVTELGKPYQSIVKEFYNTRQELAEVKKKLAAVSIPKLEDAPDPVDSPEDYKKWDAKREEAIRQDERNKSAGQPQQIDYMAEVAKRLPADADANKIIEEWSNANAYRLYDQLGELMPEVQLLYQNKPHLLYQEIIEHYNLSSKANKTDEDVRKAAHTKSKEDFKKARKTKKEMPGSDVHIVERESSVKDEDKMLANVYNIVKDEE